MPDPIAIKVFEKIIKTIKKECIRNELDKDNGGINCSSANGDCKRKIKKRK